MASFQFHPYSVLLYRKCGSMSWLSRKKISFPFLSFYPFLSFEIISLWFLSQFFSHFSSFFLYFSNIPYLILLPSWTIYRHTYGDTNKEIMCVCLCICNNMMLYAIICNTDVCIFTINMCTYIHA